MNYCPRREDGGFMFQPKTPHFFKVLLHDAIRDGKLYFPSKFVRLYGDDLSSPVLLKVPTGATWKVELVKRDGQIWLQNGWQEFIKYYSLAHGSFLVFEYNQRNYDFNVIIFDKSALEIDYPSSVSNGDNNELSVEETDQSDSSVEVLSQMSQSLKNKEKSPLPFPERNKKIKLENSTGENEAKRRTRGMSGDKQRFDGAVIRTETLIAEERDDALNKASSGFKSENPSFVVVMQPSYVQYQFRLCITSSFAMKYLNKHHGGAIHLTMGGKIWSTVYYYNVIDGKVTAKLCNGWKEFAQENNLQVGDVCVFELINVSDPTLKVVFFRGIKCSQGNNKQLKSEEGTSSCRQFVKRGSSSRAPEALEAAKNFTSVNPFFKVIIGSSYKTVNVPMEFVKKCTKRGTEKVMLQMENKRWPVKLINHSGQNRGWLSAGWSLFAKENSLQLGDVCFLELINTELLLLKVSIFRIVK